VSQLVPYIFYLACPVSMGVMMWLMMRGMHGANKDRPMEDDRVARLQREVEELRGAQRESQRDKVEMN